MLGRKVSLRFRLHDDTHPFSEAIGVLSRVSGAPEDPELTILSRRGAATRVRSSDVLAAKVFPARPAR